MTTSRRHASYLYRPWALGAYLVAQQKKVQGIDNLQAKKVRLIAAKADQFDLGNTFSGN